MPSSLDTQLSDLPEDVKATLARFHFDAARFHQLSARLVAGEGAENHVKGVLTPPAPSDIPRLPEAGSAEYARLEALGRAALEAGQVALAVLAGGMATRMGGVVKALVEALPGKTFLDLRLAEIEANRKKFGKAPPLWLMASSATEGPLLKALGARADGEQVAVFTQFSSLRLTPTGDVYRDDKGRPSEHASGHGDFPEALQKSGLIQRFVARGGKVVMLTNLDNLGGTLDPVIIGFHLAHGDPVTSEVVDKYESDRGGIPVYVDGQLCALEEFRIPPSFDPKTVRVFNTNVFHFDARTLAELDIPWTFFLVNKKVGNDPVIQFERLVNEITSYRPTRYLHVPRTGAESRFLPVKDDAELTLRRPEIAVVVQARGLL
jgi:UTP--glucose-1-phosphate uridylyltransferase